MNMVDSRRDEQEARVLHLKQKSLNVTHRTEYNVVKLRRPDDIYQTSVIRHLY